MKMLIPNHTVRGLSRKWLEEHPECNDGDDEGCGKGRRLVRRGGQGADDGARQRRVALAELRCVELRCVCLCLMSCT